MTRRLAEKRGVGNGEWQPLRQMAEPAVLKRWPRTRPAHAREPRDEPLPYAKERVGGAGRGDRSNPRSRDAVWPLSEQRAHQSHIDRRHRFVLQSEASRAVPAPSE